MNRPDEIAALADRLTAHVEALANIPMSISLAEWDAVSNDILAAAKALRLSATSPGAEVRDDWTSLSEDTSWLDGRDVVLLARGMEVSARYCKGEWSDDTPISPREYSGPVWSCFDDEFQLEIEECSRDPKQWGHDGATHWRVPLALAPAEKAGDVPTTFYSVLNKAGVEYSAYSCGGVNLFGDKGSISKAVDAFHSHSQIDDLKTQIRHWRDECGKLHSKAATPTPPSADVVQQWLWRVFNQGFPAGHEDSTNTWGDFSIISDEDAARLERSDINRCYEFVPYRPARPIQSAAPGGGTEGGEA